MSRKFWAFHGIIFQAVSDGSLEGKPVIALANCVRDGEAVAAQIAELLCHSDVGRAMKFASTEERAT